LDVASLEGGRSLRHKEKFKTVRDQIVPILVDQARLEMMNVYKPGVVEPLGATVGISMSTSSLKSVEGPFIKKDFYALYKILVSLKPLIPVSLGARELLQEHVQTRIHSTHGDVDKAALKEGDTLVIYSIDFWVTREGEVWNEETDGLWRKVLQLPEGLLQASYLNLRSTLKVKHVGTV